LLDFNNLVPSMERAQCKVVPAVVVNGVTANAPNQTGSTPLGGSRSEEARL
ncbi:hypothetical protein BAE44_0005621, partial [Dichanthelium oligosanthes]